MEQLRYRVSYDSYDGYPSLQHYSQEFSAENDEMAKRHAETFAKGKPFRLEQIRTVKVK